MCMQSHGEARTLIAEAMKTEVTKEVTNLSAHFTGIMAGPYTFLRAGLTRGSFGCHFGFVRESFRSRSAVVRGVVLRIVSGAEKKNI